MEDRKGLVKYYVFFALLIIATGVAVGYTMTKSAAAKNDAKTSAKVIEIAHKLGSYEQKNSQLPATLDDAGVNGLPSSITYTKTSNDNYKICAAYNNGATVTSTSFTSAFPPLISRYTGSASKSYGQESVNTYQLVTAHKSGQNCQDLKSPSQKLSSSLNTLNTTTAAAAKAAVVQPDPTGLLSAKCGSGGATFELKDVATVQSVDSGQGVIVLNSTTAKITDKNVVPVKTLTSIKYDPVTSVYTVKCKKATLDDIGALKPGATIAVYLYSHDSSYADQIEY